MLHPVVKDVEGKVYCGPTAIAAISGYPISRVYEILQRYRPLPIVGLEVWHTFRCLSDLGYEGLGRTWIMGALVDFCALHIPGTFLITSNTHYMTYSEGDILDTTSKYPMYWRIWSCQNNNKRYLTERVVAYKFRKYGEEDVVPRS